MAQSNAERQAEFRRRMEKMGLVQVTYWVPRDYKEPLDSYVLKLRNDHEKKQGA